MNDISSLKPDTKRRWRSWVRFVVMGFVVMVTLVVLLWNTNFGRRRLLPRLVLACSPQAEFDEPATAAGGRVFRVTEQGAIADDELADTAAIQAAMDKCESSGGGEVMLTGGRFIAGH